MTYYLCFIVTIALSRTETLFLSRWPWSDPSRSPKVKLVTSSDLHLMHSYLSFVDLISLSHTINEVFRILEFSWWPSPFRVTKGQIFQLFWKADVQLYNGLLLIPTRYLAPFTEYSTSKISGHDASPSADTVGHYVISSLRHYVFFLLTGRTSSTEKISWWKQLFCNWTRISTYSQHPVCWSTYY